MMMCLVPTTRSVISAITCSHVCTIHIYIRFPQETSKLTFTTWLYNTCFKFDKHEEAYASRELTLAEQRSEGSSSKKKLSGGRGGGGRGRGRG